MKDQKLNEGRRTFIAQSAALLGGAAAMAIVPKAIAGPTVDGSILESERSDSDYTLNRPENILYTACLNCNTGCGIKCKIENGVLSKIDGNPYNPWTMVPHIPDAATLDEAARIDGAICPKGQAGIQIAYDPYRIRKVLKRAGKRGENKWVSIPFDQAIKEIVEGGVLFPNIPGEATRSVEGLRSIMALRDGAAAKAMASSVKAIWDEKDKDKKKGLVSEFQKTHKKYLSALIDPEHPDFGAKNNQFVMAWGRMKGGRSDFFKRFGSGFGTTNLHGHTTVCQGSLYFTCKAISEQYFTGKFANGQKFYWQADLEHAKYVVFVGANLFEANYGPTNRTVRLTENLNSGFTKIAVVDPRFSTLASKASAWLPIKPGEDAALGMAFIRWMIENDRFDKAFLGNANKAAATKNGELSWTNSSWLVEIKDGNAGKFVRASDLGYADKASWMAPDPKKKGEFIGYFEKFMLVMNNGKPLAFQPNDESKPVTGDLFVDTEIESKKDGSRVRVKSSLQLLKEEAFQKSFAEWCEIAGVDASAAEEVVRELTSYGKQAGVDIHRGVAQHTNGFYNVFTWMSVNMLLGNFDWAGGMAAPSTYGYDGSKGGPFDLTGVPGEIPGFGVSSIRHDIAYDKTTIFEGYPAKRNWYPLASDVYQETIPSIGDQYPYPVKALFFYMGAPNYALPAGQVAHDVLIDLDKLPLFFCSDIVIGSTSMYADYIFPDLTYLERWEFQGSHPNMINKVQPVRQPVIAPIPETVTVFGERIPISLEALLMGLSEQLGLKAFGQDALGRGMDIKRPEDFYLRGVANIALGAKAGEEVPDSNGEEEQWFVQARKHLPDTVFDEEHWRSVVGSKNWKKVVHVLSRGGRFQEHAKGVKGDQLANPYGKLLNLYQEKTASNKYAGTGKHYSGVATYLPQKNYGGESLDSLAAGHDLHLITNRTILQTKSRTNGCYWLTSILPENSILISSSDAARIGLSSGDSVRVVSATNPDGVWDFKNGQKKDIIGKVEVTEGLRPGVVSFVLGFGHWASGANDIELDNEVVKGDERRATGVHANAVMWTDPTLRNNTCLLDPVGGSVSFYDTRVRLLKV